MKKAKAKAQEVRKEQVDATLKEKRNKIINDEEEKDMDTESHEDEVPAKKGGRGKSTKNKRVSFAHLGPR